MSDDNVNKNYDESLSIEELDDNINEEIHINNELNSPQMKDDKGIKSNETDLNGKGIPFAEEKNQNDFDEPNDINSPDNSKEKYDSNKDAVNQELHQMGHLNENLRQDSLSQNKGPVFKLTNNTFTGNTTLNKNSIHVRNPVPMSKLQLVENKYYKLKGELDVFLANCSIVDDSNINAKISKQNKEMISYFDQLNNILTSIIDNTKIQAKRKKSPPHQHHHHQELPQEAQVIINTNNAKLVDAYKKEYLRLENRLKQVSEPNYQYNLEAELKELNDSLALIEIENKKLKQEQKKNDIVIEKQSKNTNSSNKDLKRLSMDLEAIKRQNQSAIAKIDKKKMNINDNEIQINQLKILKDSLEKKAQELYNITEYENVKEEEKNDKMIQDKKNHLKRKIEVYEKVLLSNKKKYEMEISKNEKILFQIRIDRNALHNQLKEIGATMNSKIEYKNNNEDKKMNVKGIQKEEIMKDLMNNQDKQQLLSEQISQNTSGVIIKKNITKPKFVFKPMKSDVRIQKKSEEKPLNEERQMTDYQQSESKDIRENIIVSNREEVPHLQEGYVLKIEGEATNQELVHKEEIAVNGDKAEVINVKEKEKEDIEGNNKEENGHVIDHKTVPAFLEDLNDDDDYDDDTNNNLAEFEKPCEEPNPTFERKTKTEIIQKDTVVDSKLNNLNFKTNDNPLLLKSHNEFDQLEEYYI